MTYKKKGDGFTLLEIMVVITIIGILAAIAIPSYSEYIKKTRLNTAAQKAEHLQLLLHEYWEDNKTYIAGNDATLQTTLGWHSGDSDITSKVEPGTNGIETSFIITVTHADAIDEPVILEYTHN